MFSVQAEYKRAGLEVHGAELPDHAAVELEFLSFLAEQEARGGELARKWYRTRRRFLRDHTSRWLPDVGHQLTTVNDPAWQAIGLLLSAMSTSPETKSVTKEPLGLPQVNQVEQCSLCGFCAQVCPTGALSMVEDARSTRLTLYPDLCTHCQKCVRTCEEGLLKMNGHPEEVQIMTLKWSERAACPKCGSPTISQAELAAVINLLGEHPLWLDYCLECRSLQA
jgi:ferredoxin